MPLASRMPTGTAEHRQQRRQSSPVSPVNILDAQRYQQLLLAVDLALRRRAACIPCRRVRGKLVNSLAIARLHLALGACKVSIGSLSWPRMCGQHCMRHCISS